MTRCGPVRGGGGLPPPPCFSSCLIDLPPARGAIRQPGLAEPFPGAENVLPWLDEQANLRKEKNFFETRVTEYQTGGALSWE